MTAGYKQIKKKERKKGKRIRKITTPMPVVPKGTV
jgi:hypothetical protein